MVAHAKQSNSVSFLEKESEFSVADLGNAKLTLTPSGRVRFEAPEDLHVHDAIRYIESVKSFLAQHNFSEAITNEAGNHFLNWESLLKTNPGIADDVASTFKKRASTELFVAAHNKKGAISSVEGQNNDVLAFLYKELDVKGIKINKTGRFLELDSTSIKKLEQHGFIDSKYFDTPDHNIPHDEKLSILALATQALGRVN